MFASCRKEEDAARLRSEGLESLTLDLSSPQSISGALDHILALTGGTLDALYNNGAFALPGALEDLPRDGLRSVFETNVFGTHDLTVRTLKIMRAQGHGRIINCSSVLGLVPYAWRGAYSASKFALEGLTDTLRIEMRDTPIHIITLEPGPITSRIRENSIPHFEEHIDWQNSPRATQYKDELLKRLYEDSGPDRFELPPAAVSAKLVHALESPRPRSRYMVTTPTYLMLAARRILPRAWLDWLIAKG